MVSLVPADQSPFPELTVDVAKRWPDHPPHEGVHDEVTSHLTLVETSRHRARRSARAAASALGRFDAAADELLVITEDEAGRWHTRWGLPFEPAAQGSNRD